MSDLSIGIFPAVRLSMLTRPTDSQDAELGGIYDAAGRRIAECRHNAHLDAPDQLIPQDRRDHTGRLRSQVDCRPERRSARRRSRQPILPHHETAYAAYRDASDAWRQRHPWGASRTELAEAEQQPQPPDAYCADCRSALGQPGAVWPAEVWAYLNAMAASDATGKPKAALLRPYRLPADPTPSRLTPDAWRAQALKAYQPKIDGTTAREQAVIGKFLGRDEADRSYYITTTNGHCLVADVGPASDERPYGGLSVKAEGPWVDLPPIFQLALRRVAIFASARSGAVRLTVEPGQLTLSARDAEGEASEVLDVVTPSDLPEAIVTLSADYLRAVCGSWPLRWYVRPPERPQLFVTPASTTRALIMPMRAD